MMPKSPWLLSLRRAVFQMACLRDVVAFPKTQRAQDLLMNAPGVVEQQQLDELTIRVELPRE